MGGIVIIGSGSALYNKHFRDRIRNYCGSNRQFLEFKGRVCHKAIPSVDAYIYVVFSDPRRDYTAYHQSLIQKFKNLILISSTAVLCESDFYSYVKRKTSLEFIYKMNSKIIFRVGLTPDKEVARNISLCLPISDFQKIIEVFENLHSGESIVNAYEFKNNKSKFRIVGHVYFLLTRFLPRPFLRPIDLLLKMFGFVGYGYSFYKC